MLKVGIVTMHRPLNVGCTLQAMATALAIEKCGHMPEIIDYYYPNKLHRQRTVKYRLLHSANKLVARVLLGAAFVRREKRYDEFLHRLPLSRPYFSKDEIDGENQFDYDVVCSGSDQIWNPNFISKDTTFFCGFAPASIKRISYASSFGVLSVPEQYREIYLAHLSHYRHVSCREKSGVALLRDELGVAATRVLDPTLLFSSDVWMRQAAPVRLPQAPYVFCYGAPLPDGAMEKLAIKIARSNGWDVVRMHGRPWQRFSPGIKYVFDIGPAEFLTWVSHAAFVVTSSFHGTCFSLNFNRPFLSMTSKVAPNIRILDLLELIGCENRIGYDSRPDELECHVDLKSPDRQEALAKEREMSFAYLKKALEY